MKAKKQGTHLRTMQKTTQLVGWALVCVIASSCSGNKQKTLGQLKYEPEHEEPIVFEKLNHEQVRQEYKALLDEFEDDKLKEQIERRIADVYMMEGGHDQQAQEQQESYYLDAIKAYKNILERYPNSPDNAEVLYQLAKAYDMEAQQDQARTMLEELTTRHPNYPNNGEAYFRLADIYFSHQEYTKSAKAYKAVTESDTIKLHLNAYYMLAWSQYKLAQFNASARTFAYVLSEHLGTSEDAEALEKTKRSIVQDTIHSLSLTLDKIGGASAIATLEDLKGKPYAWLVYQELGQYYFDKELYEQSANAYRHFLEANQLSKRAPNFHKRIIDTYTEGGFPKLALEEKEAYINHFGIHSAYYATHNAEDSTLENLNVFIDELARFHYSRGSDATKQLATLNSLEKPKPSEIKKAQAKETSAYSTAAAFYGQYLETFPSDVRFDEVKFLQAEAFFVAKDYQQAAQGYEYVAYTPLGDSAKQHAADAGYAAILSHQKFVDLQKPNSEAHTQAQVATVDSMLRFAEIYHSDERSPGVLTNAAEFLFSLNQYQRAIDISLKLVEGNSKLDTQLKKTAFGILAHSYFKLEDYANAQAAYINQRELSDETSEEYTAISERLASTTYKLSEVHLAENDTSSAIAELLKIKTLTPDSPIRVIAQYDATSLMLTEKMWAPAISELTELNALFPEHELAAEFPRKLAYAYREDEQWLKAAETYLHLHKNDNTPEVRREALFAAAEMFEQNKSYDTAIENYKAYTYAYEEPFETRMEARYKLAVNYTLIGEEGKALYWLRRIIDGNESAGAKQTERSRWLAAWAHIEYGASFSKEFSLKRLSLPIVQSLPKKKQAMENAISHYEKAADFGFLEFVTQSSVKVAGLYTELAQSIRKSPRPKGLSENDLEMYNRIMTEQALPLDMLAADLHLVNAERAWGGEYNKWIAISFEKLRELAPERFAKDEKLAIYGDEIR